MTYVVTDACIRCKYMDCVEVCPVDCFYEGENMLVIHPDECIDCGVCEPECPAEAIKPDTEPGLEKWLPPPMQMTGKAFRASSRSISAPNLVRATNPSQPLPGSLNPQKASGNCEEKRLSSCVNCLFSGRPSNGPVLVLYMSHRNFRERRRTPDRKV